MLPMLPPQFESKEAHTYGQLTIRLQSLPESKVKITKAEPYFFGSNLKGTKANTESQPLTFRFRIATNLWHFYAYLSDCRNIPFLIVDDCYQAYKCEMPITLLPSSQVLSKNNKNIDFLFRSNGYLLETKQKLKIFDDNKKGVSTISGQLLLQFDQDINRVLFEAGAINLEDLLIIDGISPIPSSMELQNFQQKKWEKPQNFQKTALQLLQKVSQPPKQNQKKSILINNQKKPRQISQLRNLQKDFLQLNETPIVAKNFEQDQRMIEDDIDRLIAEMQNRPYDSSRYVQTQTPTEKKENYNYGNTPPQYPSANQKPQHKMNYNNLPDLMPPKYPSSNKAESFKDEHSPLRANTIYSYSAIPAQSERSNYLISKTGFVSRETKGSAEKRTSMGKSRQKYEISSQNGNIRLKIHQLMMQRYEENLSLVLKCFLNDDSDEYYTASGIKQGQSISFNSNLVINEQREVNLLRFLLIDSYDMKSIYASGEFQMQRLFALQPTKGVFTVNMKTSQTQRSNSRSKVLSVQESRLVKVLPNIKTLRIELEYQQHIEIVQIYLALSNFNKTVKKCRYKIPMTKQTIQFSSNQLSCNKHINIFPHNRSSQNKAQEKIILQLWGAEQLLGISQIGLKQLQNTNQRIIASSLEPIYLYDEERTVQNIKGGKINNMFHLQLYYGTISQVQALLNQVQRKQPRQHNKKQVQVQQMLGVYVKQRKRQSQVQIQVDSHEMQEEISENEKFLSKTACLGLQQQVLPEQEEDQQIQNQFLNKSLQQKYLGQQTLPLFGKIQNKFQDLDLKKTEQKGSYDAIKVKPILKSLTGNFQELIKQSLCDFSNEESLKQLKIKVKDHLLYNFIELESLKRILQDLGVSNNSSNTILHQVIGHSNGMINVNLLYDIIYGLMLDGFVKEKYIDDAQLGKYCLSQLYKNLQSGQQTCQDFLFDDNVEYEESKKIFQKIGFKLTMREHNQIEIYTKKMKQSSLGQQSIKESLLAKMQSKQKEEKQKEKYQKEVLNNLYHQQWDQDDDFFISNINQPQQSSNVSFANQNSNKSLNTSHQSQAITTSHMETITTSQMVTISNQHKTSQQAKAFQAPISFRKPESLKNLSQSNAMNFKMFIQGFQNSIQTTQCHLNVTLRDPKLSILYKNETQQTQVILNKSQKSFQLQLQKQKEYLDGSIELKNGNVTIAKCNYSIIVDVRSVYTLKSVNQAEFCGLLYLKFSPL